MTTDAVNTRGYVMEVYQDPEDRSWVAEIPDLPGCLAAGETLDEALGLVEDAIDAWIVAATADGRAVPVPRPVEDEYSGRFVLRVAKTLHRRLAATAKREGVSLNTLCVTFLAEGLGVARAQAPAVTTSAFQFRVPENAHGLLSGHLNAYWMKPAQDYQTAGSALTRVGWLAQRVGERSA